MGKFGLLAWALYTAFFGSTRNSTNVGLPDLESLWNSASGGVLIILFEPGPRSTQMITLIYIISLCARCTSRKKPPSKSKFSKGFCEMAQKPRVSSRNGGFWTWCCSLSHHYICTAEIERPKWDHFLIPLVKHILLAIGNFLPDGFWFN